jgi:hypothetical protein
LGIGTTPVYYSLIMRIRVMPKEVFPGIEISPDGKQEFSIGALADHLNIGDGVVLYTPNDDFSECSVFAVAEVVAVDQVRDTCSLDVRRHSNVIYPSGNAGWRWRDNRYLCLDKPKIEKYELINLFERAFNDDSWHQRPLQDESNRYAKFDLSKRTLLPTWGYVYLFKSSDAYKIGMAKNTFARKKRIESKKKLELHFIHEFSSNDYKRAEATLHLEFAHCRRGRSEFFDLTPSEVEQIQAISQMDFPLP